MGLSYIWFSQINRGIFPSCVHLSNIQVSYWAVSYLIIEHFNVICQHRGLWVKVPPFSTLYFAISDWFSSSSDDKPSWCPTMSFISRARLLRDLKSKIAFNLRLCWGVWQNMSQIQTKFSALYIHYFYLRASLSAVRLCFSTASGEVRSTFAVPENMTINISFQYQSGQSCSLQLCNVKLLIPNFKDNIVFHQVKTNIHVQVITVKFHN